MIHPNKKTHFKLNLKKNDLEVPIPISIFTNLSFVEQRVLALVEPFARISLKSFKESCTGTSTFVPIECSQWMNKIYAPILEQKQFRLAQIYRHPLAFKAYFLGYVDTEILQKAIEFLMRNHEGYKEVM